MLTNPNPENVIIAGFLVRYIVNFDQRLLSLSFFLGHVSFLISRVKSMQMFGSWFPTSDLISLNLWGFITEWLVYHLKKAAAKLYRVFSSEIWQNFERKLLSRRNRFPYSQYACCDDAGMNQECNSGHIFQVQYKTQRIEI